MYIQIINYYQVPHFFSKSSLSSPPFIITTLPFPPPPPLEPKTPSMWFTDDILAFISVDPGLQAEPCRRPCLVYQRVNQSNIFRGFGNPGKPARSGGKGTLDVSDQLVTNKLRGLRDCVRNC